MPRAPHLFALAFLVALSGCTVGALRSPFGGGGGEGGGREAAIRVQVVNLNFSDATIHVIRGGRRVRLGIVTGKTDRTYTLDWAGTESFRVDIDLLAGVRCTTPPRDVHPGEVIQIQVPVELRSSPDCR